MAFLIMQFANISSALLYHFATRWFQMDGPTDTQSLPMTSTGVIGDIVLDDESNPIELTRRHELVACTNVSWAPLTCLSALQCHETGAALAVVSKSCVHIWCCSDRRVEKHFHLTALAANPTLGHFTCVSWQHHQPSKTKLFDMHVDNGFRASDRQYKWSVLTLDNDRTAVTKKLVCYIPMIMVLTCIQA